MSNLNSAKTKRPLSEITDEELREVCLLSGEVLHDFILEKIERERDLDDKIRFIEVRCKDVYKDGSSCQKIICFNTSGIVWVVDKKRTPCDNICRRDVIMGQYEILFYLLRKGFDFSEQQNSTELFLNDREKWLHRNDIPDFGQEYEDNQREADNLVNEFDEFDEFDELG